VLHIFSPGAEPGRRYLKMPAEKLGPVIVAFDKERRIPDTGASHLKKLNHCKEMGAEPGRRSLKMPAEKLWPVFVAFDKER